MPTFETRIARNGVKSIRVKIRRKGATPASASFARMTAARKWAQDTESAIRDGRYFKGAAANRRTLAEAIDRYALEVLLGKPRTAKSKARQLAWWRAELGHQKLAALSKRKVFSAFQTA